MSAEEKRICRTCGTGLAPHDEFCPVCAFRGALKSDETATEPSDLEPEASRFGHYEIFRHSLVHGRHPSSRLPLSLALIALLSADTNTDSTSKAYT